MFLSTPKTVFIVGGFGGDGLFLVLLMMGCVCVRSVCIDNRYVCMQRAFKNVMVRNVRFRVKEHVPVIGVPV